MDLYISTTILKLSIRPVKPHPIIDSTKYITDHTVHIKILWIKSHRQTIQNFHLYISSNPIQFFLQLA